jgi:hypothetical protein
MAFHPINRDTDYLLPPSVQDWLPESHLARYVDLTTILQQCEHFAKKAGGFRHTFPF